MKSDKPSVLITGANGGIGRALVKAFGAHDYYVIATDLNPDGRELPCDHFIQIDVEKTVTDEKYATNVFKKIRDALPQNKLNSLVNNAAIQILAPTDQLSRGDWSKTINTNLLAPFFWIQEFLEEMVAANGCVVNISSIHAQLTKAEFAAYATSKAALSALTRNLAVDLGDRIRINAIEPAAVATNMLLAGFEGKADKYSQLESLHPLKRIATPKEIAELAVYLSSKESSFIHGSCISASGGIHGCLSDPN